jgi:aspartyl-tRNA(Asn)/glutamyl-tRNA(Gln) amidotransferase subunit B
LCNKNNLDISQATVCATDIAKLNNYIGDGKISMKQAKEILSESWESSVSVDQIIKKNNIEQISDPDLLTNVVKKLLEMHPKEVQDYKNGKEKLMGFFIGQIMKETQGKANPKILNQVLIKLLKGV